MANVLDLRRRIRSVRNTRQITRAMKMVSAAKLRRAQERAISARPYAAMLASVLESLKRRTTIYDPETGELGHPLLITRPEERILIVVVSGDKGFAGAFNTNVLKAAANFITENGSKHIDIESIGRKGRDLFRRRYPAAQFLEAAEVGGRERRQTGSNIEVVGDQVGLLERLDYERVRALADEIIARYVHEEIDAAYVVYNEFKSVIQQRVVIERILPILEIGSRQLAGTQEMTTEERERAAEAALSSVVSLYPQEAAAAQQEFENEPEAYAEPIPDKVYDEYGDRLDGSE